MGFTASLLVTDVPDARQSQRRAIDSESTLRAHRTAMDVVVTDLSRTGCAISTPANLAIGAEISVGLVGFGAFDATIVRRSGEIYGCEFKQSISAHIVQNAFAESTVVAAPVSPTPDSAPTTAPTFADPVTRRWSPMYRLAFIVGASAMLWYGLFTLAF